MRLDLFFSFQYAFSGGETLVKEIFTEMILGFYVFRKHVTQPCGKDLLCSFFNEKIKAVFLFRQDGYLIAEPVKKSRSEKF